MDGNGKLIGLIGGVGPWAGLDVHQKIIQQAAYDREQDCVGVMHLSFPGNYTDRTDFLLGKTTINPAHAFIRELRLLESTGVDSAAIVCNTAHATPILNVIESAFEHSTLNYVNIIKETQRELESHGVKKVGLLATLGTYSLDLYQHGFNGTMIHPSTSNQKRVHNIIYNQEIGLKTQYPKSLDYLCKELIAVAQTLIDQGVEAFVLGCTELPLLADFSKHIELPVYDPNHILAKALIEQAYSTAPLLEKQCTI